MLGAPPVEAVACGPALARAAGLERAEDVLADPALAPLVDAAATALGGALAVLANALDPSLVVLGGGLGAQRAFSERVARACPRALLAYPRVPPLPVVSSTLGPDGGVIGAALVAHSAAAVRLRAVLDGTGLWRDVDDLLRRLVEQRSHDDGRPGREVAALLGGDGVRRVVASGNGAAYYVAVALWLASLEGARRSAGRGGAERPPCARRVRLAAWRRPARVSSSGEFRDLVEAIDAGAPAPYAAVTANAGSTLGSRAAARALVSVPNQLRRDAHTGVLWRRRGGAPRLGEGHVRSGTSTRRSDGSPTELERTIAGRPAWVDERRRGRRRDRRRLRQRPRVGGRAGGRPPPEGGRRRSRRRASRPAEGATSAMMALRPGALALSLPRPPTTRCWTEAEAICAGRGATVLRAPGGATADRRLAAVSTFPAAAALSARLGLDRGLDIDAPDWTDAYYRAARPHPG